jgi:hypothetical protein
MRKIGALIGVLASIAAVGCGGQPSARQRQHLQEEHEQDSSIAIKEKEFNSE